MSDSIIPILMPKWGLSMQEGLLSVWHVEEGAQISPGDEIMDVETDKIANVVEAADGGLLRRIVGEEDLTYPVQALLAVMAPSSVTDAEIDAYIAAFEAPELEEGEADEGPTYQFAELSTGRIRYAERSAEGTAVVLIHGFGGDLDNWLFNIDALAQERPTYALDLPGHGQSVKSIDSPDLDTMVSAIVEFMDHLDIDKAHLVGHSMGGLIAGKVAIENPQRVASLGLICSAGLGPEINDGYISGFTQAVTRRDLKPVLLNLFADSGLVNRAMVDDLLKYKRLDGVHDFLGALSKNMFGGGKQVINIAAALDQAATPLLLIAGAEDAVIPAAHIDNVPRATRQVIENAGHMVQMEQAGKVNELLMSHIKSIA